MIKKITSMALMVMLCCNLHLMAQVTTATITGTVFDEKNVSLPGANIVALHIPSGTRYITTTRTNGSFTFPNVRTGGPYTLTTTFVGYGETVIDEINLSLGQELEVDIPMRISGTDIKEVVVSRKQDRTFNADRTGAATTITNENLRSLPTLSRSISDMTRISPQATGNNTFAGRNNLYNNLAINGAVFNNSFGLSSTPGGQTNAQPISLDAIDQIQVSLAPYDVRQSGFTGAGINAITRSGTNEFSGSAYRYWRNQNYVGSKVAGNDVVNNNFDQSQMGFRLGGPIIKNKLFFFINGEMERKNEPAHTWLAARPGLSGSNVSTVPASALDSLKDFLISKYNYDPGSYENFSLKTYNDKFLIRLDYNLAKNHKLSINYNYLKSWKDITPSTGNSATSRSANANTLWFSNSVYQINNNINSLLAELNSTFGNKASNNLIVGYSAFRDFRSSKSDPFPVVDILRSGTTLTSFGYEQYTPNNKLNTDVFQLSDNFSLYLGQHTLTFGGAYEHFKFANGFTPQYYGYYRYNSLNDFYADARDGKSVTLANYQLTYSAVAGEPVPMARIETSQLGFYAQDDYKVLPNLKITAGIRMDIPSYPGSLPVNNNLNDLTFQDENGNGVKIDVSKLPGKKVMLSPRLGFNWDVFHNKKTQVRGGLGIFTGRIPFVWISNQASNNGVLFGNIYANNTKAYPFSNDVNKYIPANATAPATVLINATSSDFKFPQVFRTNLAVDQQLPYGVIATIEGMYTKDINAVIHHDYNLKQPSGNLYDGRDTFPKVTRINSAVTNAYVLGNTNQGYSYFITTQLQKSFNMGLYASVAYTYGETKDLSGNPGSIASSAFTGNPVKSNPNKPELSWSTYDQPHKVVGLLSYRKEYLGHMASAISMIYMGVQGGGGSSNERQSDGRFSYTYAGDLNRDGISGNDLIYIPKDKSDINLISKDTRTVDEIWNQLDAYIEQDSYLKKHRGQIMDRNAAITPWNSQIDLKFTQDFYLNVAGRRNTLQFSVDVINFGNMLNSDWGVKKTVNKRSFLTFEDFKGPDGAPRFSFPYFDPTNKVPLTSTFSNDNSLASRWQLQFGIRYTF